jgi:hypothetical protein
VEEAGRAAYLAVEAAKDAAQCIMLQMTELWGFNQMEKDQEVELRPSQKRKRAQSARACIKQMWMNYLTLILP